MSLVNKVALQRRAQGLSLHLALPFLSEKIAAMLEPSLGILSSDGEQCLTNSFFQRFSGSGSRSSQDRLELGECFLNGERSGE